MIFVTTFNIINDSINASITVSYFYHLYVQMFNLVVLLVDNVASAD